MPTGKPDYSKACIYKIWSPLTDRIYIGSTCDMTKRWCNHKSHYKKWKEGKRNNICSSSVLFDLVGLENCKIEWVNDFPCETKKQLNKEEGRVQRQYKDLIINKGIAGRSKKEYYKDNKQELNIKIKEYHQQHKQEIKEYLKEYQQQHKEELSIKAKEYYKEYYDNNKEELSIKGKQKITCECGSIHTLNNKSVHLKTQKHQDFIKPQ